MEMGFTDLKTRVLNFIKYYLSYIIVIVMSVVYLGIDLIAFGVQQDPSIVILKAVIYIAMSVTISALLRQQGVIHGKNDEAVLKALEDYDKSITDNQSESERLDEWCESKNEFRRITEIKKHLKYAHLSYEEWEKGSFEIPSVRKEKKAFKKRFSKRQYKCIKWCNSCVVELYSAEYLTSEMEREKKKAIAKNVSVSSYLTKKGGRNILTSIASSIAFAFLTISLAKDISWANLIYSFVKVISWIGGGVVGLFNAYLFITSTYKDSVKDKTKKLNEFSCWCKDHPKAKKEEAAVPVPVLVNS